MQRGSWLDHRADALVVWCVTGRPTYRHRVGAGFRCDFLSLFDCRVGMFGIPKADETASSGSAGGLIDGNPSISQWTERTESVVSAHLYAQRSPDSQCVEFLLSNFEGKISNE